MTEKNSHEPTHWSKARERGAIFWLKFMQFSYRILGRRVVNLFLYPTVTYFFIFGRRQRAALRKYFIRLTASPEGQRALGHAPGPRDEFRVLLEFARAAVDKFAAWSGEITKSNVIWHNDHLILNRAENGLGGLIFGAHLGNLEALRGIAGNHPTLKINALMFIDHSERYNQILSETCPDVFNHVILTNKIGPDTAIDLQNRIDRGEYIAVLADRATDGSEDRIVSVPFLGENASFPTGPFILASLLNTPVFTVFSYRRNFSSYEVFIEEFSERITFDRNRRREAIAEEVARFAEVLEGQCRRSPHQWFNFFDFWQSSVSTGNPPSLINAEKNYEHLTHSPLAHTLCIHHESVPKEPD